MLRISQYENIKVNSLIIQLEVRIYNINFKIDILFIMEIFNLKIIEIKEKLKLLKYIVNHI